MEVIFNTFGNDKQKDCARAWLDNSVSEIIYGGSKGSAKSYTGCSLIFGDAFIYPGIHCFIARDKLNDLRKYTIPSIYEVFNHWGVTQEIYTYNGQDSYFLLHNDSKVFLIDAPYMPRDPLFQRFGSMQMTRGWIEEAGQFQKAAKDALSASLGRWKNDEYKLKAKLLQTCNPSKNYLYQDYKLNKEKKLPEHKRFIQAFPEDNKKLPEGYIENLHKILSGNEKQRLLYGNWEYDDDPATLINYESIISSFTNNFVPKGQKYITADIARFGKDNTVLIRWEGFRAEEIVTISKSSITDTAKAIREMAFKNLIPIHNVLVDEDGVGGGVRDILNCKGFVNNSTPLLGENYSNLKSQCHFKFSERMNRNEVYICCKEESVKEKIIEELEQVKQKDIDKDGKKGIIPKDIVKDMIGRSPDYSDALTMREFFGLIFNNRVI